MISRAARAVAFVSLLLVPGYINARGQTAAAQAPAATHPDFSGRWAVADPAAPGGGPGGGPAGGGGGGQGGRGDMGSGWGTPLTITQDANRLTVEYAFFARGDMQPPLKFVYALDGSETRNSVMMGRGTQLQTARTSWDGAKLVITTTHTFADPTTGKPATIDVKQILSLDGASMTVETIRAGVLGGPATTTKTTYRKL